MVILQQDFVFLACPMQSTPSYYPKQISFPTNTNIYNKNFFKPNSKAEAKLIDAKKHSESEKRRRMRINSQYTTLRDILPNLIKVNQNGDKASLLAEAVRRDECVLPGGVDKLSIEQCEGEKEGLVKATCSCEDRPGLKSEMTRAPSCVKGRVVRAEMVTVGGRSKNAVWLQRLGGGNEGVVALKRALKMVADRPVLPRNVSKKLPFPR
ncbi:transcription factor bHLH131-like [Malus sylvestris]|uniref:transcription factor bHLH131-like n=1 Tax=Malus sylvestris TaxID=3752 RepID=UPI0021ABAA49|nr:transcription factor bHLH131-like [Malus sylvestris]